MLQKKKKNRISVILGLISISDFRTVFSRVIFSRGYFVEMAKVPSSSLHSFSLSFSLFLVTIFYLMSTPSIFINNEYYIYIMPSVNIIVTYFVKC